MTSMQGPRRRSNAPISSTERARVEKRGSRGRREKGEGGGGGGGGGGGEGGRRRENVDEGEGEGVAQLLKILPHIQLPHEDDTLLRLTGTSDISYSVC